jgi:hypothetical protein
MNRRSRIAAAFGTAGLLLSLAPAHAYRMIQPTTTGRVTAGNAVTCSDPGGFAHWNIRNINWYHNTAGQGSGKATALTNAMTSWTNVSAANYVLNYAGTTAAGFVTDSQNTIGWGTGNGCSGTCLALTALVISNTSWVIVETDITFNSAQTWTTNGSNYDTEAVAAHELGHTLGIHHTEVVSTPHPTMYTPYFGSDGRTLEGDDQAALQCAESQYPPPACGGPNAICVVDSDCCSNMCWIKTLPKKCI